MKKIKGIAVMILCVLLAFPTAVFGSEEQTAAVKSRLTVDKSYEAVRCEAGKSVTLTVPLINKEKYTISDVVVTPVQSADTSVYPFEIETTNLYDDIPGEIAPGGTGKVEFSLTTREDVTTGYVKMNFQISYLMHIPGDGDGEGSLQEMETERSLYVRTVAAKKPAKEPTEEPTKKPTPTEEPVEDMGEDSFGGYSGGDIGGGDLGGGESSGDEKNGSTPRVIIEGFTTTPSEVNAGDTFDLKLKVKNTSKKTAVSNMVLTLQTPEAGEGETATEAFLPASGANMVYIEQIPKNSTKEVTITLSSRSDLVQKPYPMEIQLKYEDQDANAFEGTLNISIPVKQKARFELSTVQVMPESISVGEETNVTFEIYNLGKTKLYNVSAKIEDETLVNGEAFVGNLEAGATGSVDMMVQGAAETTGDGTVKLIVTYEDQDGKQDTYETTCSIYVSPAMEFSDEPLYDGEMMEMESEEGGSHFWIWIIVAAVIVGVIVGGVALARRKRRKDEEWANELLGSDKDELQ